MENQDDLPNVTLTTLSSVMAKHDGVIQVCLKIVDPKIEDKFEVLLDKEVFEFKDIEGVTFNKRRVIIWQPLGEARAQSEVSALAVSTSKSLMLYGRDGQLMYASALAIEDAYTLLDLTINMSAIFL